MSQIQETAAVMPAIYKTPLELRRTSGELPASVRESLGTMHDRRCRKLWKAESHKESRNIRAVTRSETVRLAIEAADEVEIEAGMRVTLREYGLVLHVPDWVTQVVDG